MYPRPENRLRNGLQRRRLQSNRRPAHGHPENRLRNRQQQTQEVAVILTRAQLDGAGSCVPCLAQS